MTRGVASLRAFFAKSRFPGFRLRAGFKKRNTLSRATWMDCPPSRIPHEGGSRGWDFVVRTNPLTTRDDDRLSKEMAHPFEEVIHSLNLSFSPIHPLSVSQVYSQFPGLNPSFSPFHPLSGSQVYPSYPASISLFLRFSHSPALMFFFHSRASISLFHRFSHSPFLSFLLSHPASTSRFPRFSHSPILFALF
jgi:hypothetical protein